MPALNIIATHDTVRNSGFSSSWPSGMLPYLLDRQPQDEDDERRRQEHEQPAGVGHATQVRAAVEP